MHVRGGFVNAPTRKRRWLTISAATALAALFAIPAAAAPGHPATHPRAFTAQATAADGGGDDDGGEEADEIAEGADQFTDARTSPGTLLPGAFRAAWDQMNALPGTGGSWQHVTGLPY